MSILYLVHRVSLELWEDGCPHRVWEEDTQNAVLVPVRAFPDRISANSCRDSLEAEARRLISPLRLKELLPLPLDEFDVRMTSLGLEPIGLAAPTLSPDWSNYRKLVKAWWRRQLPKLTPEVIDALWEMFPHSEPLFYYVTETTLDD